jgi:hypothetical protein
MAVGDQDLLEAQAFVFKHLDDALDVAARIDDGRLAALLAPEDGAVLLE